VTISRRLSALVAKLRRTNDEVVDVGAVADFTAVAQPDFATGRCIGRAPGPPACRSGRTGEVARLRWGEGHLAEEGMCPFGDHGAVFGQAGMSPSSQASLCRQAARWRLGEDTGLSE